MKCLKLLILLSIPFLIICSPPKTNKKESVLEGRRPYKIERKTEKMSADQLVEYVNARQTLWKAVKNRRFANYNEEIRNGMMGVKNIHLPMETKRRLSSTRHLNISIPETFDSREWWPQCPSIGSVKDQSSCGSCWAFGAAEAISDRICIASKGKINVNIAVNDLLACCKECGEGCQGGYPIKAWDYWVEDGLVTGGDYGSNDTCQPYPFPSCKHPDNSTYDICKRGIFDTPQCFRKCQRGYAKEFKEDKHFGLSSYGVEDNEEAIQKEIMTYGPVEVAFEVYTDFFHYSNGVYSHTAGELAGGHAVKLIGWGTDNKVPYWLLVNSWNLDWGEKGLFKIIRGTDECGIESGVVAGIPKTF